MLYFLVPSSGPLEEDTMDETQSGNLMATFLRFSSISIQDSKSMLLFWSIFLIKNALVNFVDIHYAGWSWLC